MSNLLNSKADMTLLEQNTPPNEDGFSPMYLPGGVVKEKKAAGEGILGLCKSMTSPEPIQIGMYRGFDIGLYDDIALRSAQTREELEWIIEQQEQNREAEPNVQRDEKADRQS